MVSLGALCLSFWSGAALANGDMHKVKHVIIVMQENHSFDNYFGALAYAPGSPYHTTSGGCRQEDHNCVDGLSCKIDAAGNFDVFQLQPRWQRHYGVCRSMIPDDACRPISIIPGWARTKKVIS